MLIDHREVMMKFLVFTKPKEAVNRQLPSAAQFRDQMEWFRKELAAGRIESAYHGHNHAVLIAHAESADDLEKWLDSIPLSELVDREVEPLIDLFEQMEGVLKFLQKVERDQPSKSLSTIHVTRPPLQSLNAAPRSMRTLTRRSKTRVGLSLSGRGNS
jgi:hypothetical protein